MDFQSRVTIPSIKNFQLEDSNGMVVLQFGRIGKDTFTMDFRARTSNWNHHLEPTHTVPGVLNQPYALLPVVLVFWFFGREIPPNSVYCPSVLFLSHCCLLKNRIDIMSNLFVVDDSDGSDDWGEGRSRRVVFL